MTKPKKRNWFGEQLGSKEIADRYGLHVVTITAYFRAYKTNEAVLARIKEVQSGDYIKHSKGNMNEISGLGPRKDIKEIPSPSDYERELWGRG